MKIREFRSLFTNKLSGIYDLDEAESFFYLILDTNYKIKRVDLALKPDLAFSSNEINQLNSLIEQLKKEIPIQYLLGKTSFYGLEFEVNETVLIPRPETEELVDWIVETTKLSTANKKIKILDIGTGSGCIAISLSKNIPNSEVYAVDVSDKAVETAEKNAQLNHAKIDFAQIDILQLSDLEEISKSNSSFPLHFDIIVSNPPYVRELEKKEIKKNVLHYEPHLALFVQDNNPLVFYEKITALAQKNLQKKGKLFFEINQYLGTEMVDLFHKIYFTNIELKKDIYGNDRMIHVEKL